MLRFVLLHHQMPPGARRASHWDLMLEPLAGEPLQTWALAEAPRPDRVIDAWRLQDHRPIYLDYEGPISGNRGEVSRWDAGTYERMEASESSLQLRLHGLRLAGRVLLERQPDAEARDANREEPSAPTPDQLWRFVWSR